MARALVTFERRPDGTFKPTIVWLATRSRVEAKELPGDAQRTNYKNAILKDAQTPRRDPNSPERGTWEDWIDWAENALGNGHTSWAIEVEPELTVEALYQREILNVTPSPPAAPEVESELRPSSTVPQGLSGYRRVEPK